MWRGRSVSGLDLFPEPFTPGRSLSPVLEEGRQRHGLSACSESARSSGGARFVRE